ncbi:MAG: exodeoxyribonuclease VII small subunit, partial [bacterium]
AENKEKLDKNKSNKADDFPEPESFEDAMKELESLVIKLESGTVDLKESIDVYKKARRLAAWCYDKLTAFQGELKTLGLDEEGEFKLDDLPPVE